MKRDREASFDLVNQFPGLMVGGEFELPTTTYFMKNNCCTKELIKIQVQNPCPENWVAMGHSVVYGAYLPMP